MNTVSGFKGLVLPTCKLIRFLKERQRETVKKKVKRKEISRLLLLPVLILLSSSPEAFAKKGLLSVLTWPGYADEDMVADFEKQFDASVSVTYVSSDDDMWRKISPNSGKDYDVFAVNTAELQRYLNKALVSPIDQRQIPNLGNQLPRFKTLLQSPTLSASNQLFAVPYTYSEMGIIYNRDLMTTPPVSIQSLWDPAYRSKVLAFDTSNHNFSIAAQALGFDNPFRMTDSQLQDASLKLIDLRRNILTFYSDPDEALQIYKDMDVALVFANFGTQQVNKMKEAGLNIGYVIPQEGALAWLDCWVLSAGVRNNDLAHAWINYTLTPRVGNMLVQRQGLMNTLSQPSDQQEDARILWLEALENPEKRAQLWQRIKAGDAAETFQQTP
jgi:putative spermidine/putrescine transport system substrate-binding protein